MDNCFGACDYKGIPKSDLDRFTDKIENVLNDERGRKLFRKFMHNSKLKDGLGALGIWEHIERLLNYKENAESGSRTHRNYLDDVYLLLDKAKRIEEIDSTTRERLTTALAADNKEGIEEGLQSFKEVTTRALKREYSAFRKHYIPSK